MHNKNNVSVKLYCFNHNLPPLRVLACIIEKVTHFS